MTLPRRQAVQLARIGFSAAARARVATVPLGVVAALALLSAGLGTSTAAAQEDAPYVDVPADAYYAVPVRALDQDGVFAGTLCEDGFCPSVPIDRKTMAVWTVRVLDSDEPPAVSETRFDDVDADGFHARFIERMAELGVTTGCGDGSGFCPHRNVTRAQMAVFLSRAYNLPEGPDPGFTDVPGDAWYADDVARLAASGITVGCGDGTVFCPGRHTTRGQMATFLHRAENPAGQETEQSSDTEIVGEVISISDTHGCKLSADGQLACWGDNTDGQASPPPGTYTDIAVSTNYSCAIRSDGQLACWGDNTDGRTTPPAGQYTDVTTGPVHPCAVRADGTIVCWGDSHLSYPGGGTTERPPSGTYADISLGEHVGCGIRTDQSIQCWGWTSGKLGIGPSPQGTFTAVDVTHRRACALRTDSTITCWGSHAIEAVHDAPAGSHSAVSVSGTAFVGYSCALRTDSTITCWGEDTVSFSTRVGDRWQPTTIVGLTSPPTGRYQALALTNHHACALRSDNTHTCWGSPAPPLVETITVTLSPSILNVAEGGTSSYSISLSAEPAAPITIRIEVRTGSDLSVNRSSIVFDESNWRTGEFIAVTAAQDDDTEWGFEGIDHALTSTEPAYSSITVPALSVVVEDDGADQSQTVMESPGEVSGVRVTWNESAEDLTVSWHEPTNGGPVEGYAIDRASAGSAFPTISSASGLEFADYSGRYLVTDFPLSWSALVDHGGGSFSYTLDQDVPQCYGTPSRCRYVGVIAGLFETAQVRVIAYNDAGFSVSPAIDVPTQGALDHRELQALTASWVQEYGARVSWLQEVWTYITTRLADPRPVVNPFDLQGFAFRDDQDGDPFPGYAKAGADCVHLESPDRICKSAGHGIGDTRPFDFGTTMHELGHIYTTSNDAPSSPLAIAAGYLYLTDLLTAEPSWSPGKVDDSGHPCNVFELFATAAADMVTQLANGIDIAGIDIASPTASRHSSFVWKLRACDLRVAESRWQQEIAVVWSALNGTVPQWYYDTFRMANGEWDLDALWSRMSPLPNANDYVTDQSGQSRRRGPSYFQDFVIYAFKDEFGGYCSDSTLILFQYTLGGNPWRDGGCDSVEISTEQQDPEWASSVRFEAVSAGSLLHSCGLRTDGTINCWGRNAWQQTSAPSGTFSAVSAGSEHSCGLRTDGTITCWGDDSEGQTSAPSGAFSAVSAGSFHSCGLRTDGTINCWGDNRWQQTSAPSGTFSAVSASQSHSCGLKTDGAINCWGNTNGLGGEADAPSGAFSAVSASFFHSCGLRTDGTITCWGDDSVGRTSAPSGAFSAVSAGGKHSCGLRTDGTITCWGDDRVGQTSAPSGAFSAVSAGGYHSCGLRTDGTIICWGANSDGQADPP